MTIAIIGTGRIGALLEKDKLRKKPCTHLGAIVHLSKSEIPVKNIYLCDLQEQRLDEVEKYIKIDNPDIHIIKYTDYEKMFQNNTAPDIAVIAADTKVHYFILMAAIQRGIKKIVVEKPITMDRKEAETVKKTAIQHGVKIWVNYERRFHPKYSTLKKQIESTKPYGKVLYYRGLFTTSQKKLFANDDQEGVLLHDTTHLLDLAYYLFGPQNSSLNGYPKTKDDLQKSFTLHCTHQNNISGEITTITQVPYFHFELEILFEKGRIRIGNGFTHLEKSIPSPYYDGFTSLGKIENVENSSENIMDNPFIRLYLSVYKGNYDQQLLKDACQNIITLTEE
ncbi:MAG: Gfo/Idh/MocA family oxidoreductase [Leptospirales bacterium]